MNRLVFDEVDHKYYVEVPSVTNILKTVLFKEKYDGIPDDVLKQAAQFGTNVHNAIEMNDSTNLTQKELLVYSKWLKLRESEGLMPIAAEQRVHRGLDFAGTFDAISLYKGLHCLCDYKTTAKLDLEYIAWQLSFYEWAYGIKFDKLLAIWLPKNGTAKIVEVKRKTLEELEWVIKKYKEITNGTN